jgi:esterase/lipase superfamily enzyme
MGNWVTLEALRGRAIRNRLAGTKNDKLKEVMLVAPDVDVDVFRTQLQRMGVARPRMSLFVSQDDDALALSRTIWGMSPGSATSIRSRNRTWTELADDRITVYDLTHLAKPGDNAHDRAFEGVTSVVAMIRQRMVQGQTMSEHRAIDNPLTKLGDQVTTLGR